MTGPDATSPPEQVVPHPTNINLKVNILKTTYIQKETINMIELKTLTCNRCNHVWYPRKPEEPGTCPKCKSPYWNKTRIRPIEATDEKAKA